MIGVLVFYLTRTAKNKFRSRIRRLSRPKYFISALVGLAYLYLVFFRQAAFQRPQRGTAAGPVDPGLFPMVEAGFAFVLFIMALLPWLRPSAGEGVRFTESEIQFLFPAPFRRRDLLFFRIMKGQLSIIFGVLVTVLFVARAGLFPNTVFLTVTLWMVYTFLALYRMAASLARMSLVQDGISGMRRQFGVLVIAAAAVISIVVWVIWFIPPPPRLAEANVKELASWLTRAAASGPANYLLLPFRALVRPVFSTDLLVFIQRFIPAAAVIWLVYVWVLRSHARFEEAAVIRAEKAARELDAARQGIYPARKAKSGKALRAPFRLDPGGAPFVAIFWKNLIGTGRFNANALVMAFAAIGLALAIAAQGTDRRVVFASMIGGFATAMAGFLVFVGPVILRQDLRSDLSKLEALKTYPLPGRSVVLGELLAPAVVLACAEWMLLLLAAVSMPGLGPWDRTPWNRAAVVLGAAILCPCFSAAGIVVQNATALLLPSWVQIGRASQRGIEAMGQRLITMVATLLVLVLAGVPAAVVFGIVFFAGYWAVGVAVVPAAALFAATALLSGIGAGVVWLGRLFDRFDASQELLG